MAQATTYDAVGNREDLTDLMTMIDPAQTPVWSMAAKGRADAMLHEWQVDSLATRSIAGVEEGDDVSSFENKEANIARTGNRCQRLRTTWKVTEEQQAVSTAGIEDNKAYAKMKALKELKRNIEARICSDEDLTTGAAGTPSAMRGLGDWIDNTGPGNLTSTYHTPDASYLATLTANFTETILNNVQQSVYEQSGEMNSYVFVLGPNLKQAVTLLGRNQTVAATSSAVAIRATVEQASSNSLTANILEYEGDFGSLTLINSVHLGIGTDGAFDEVSQARGYIFRPSMIEVNELIATHDKDLEDQGGGPRGYVSSTLTLTVKNPLDFGGFNGAS